MNPESVKRAAWPLSIVLLAAAGTFAVTMGRASRWACSLT
jgi:hypothetical protein